MTAPVMPFSPLDALIDNLHKVRKAGRVRPGDTVSTVNQRMADVFLPIVKKIQQQAVDNFKATLSDIDYVLNVDATWKAKNAALALAWKLLNGLLTDNQLDFKPADGSPTARQQMDIIKKALK